MKEDSLSLQTSHTLRELPPRAPALTWQSVVSLCMMRVLSGEVFSFWEVEIWSRVRLRARFEGGMRRGKSGRGAPCGLRPCRVRNLSKMLRCRERPMCRSGLGERYLLTTMEFCTRVPRSRLPAPLRGSTPRHFQLYCSFLQRDAAPLRMTRRVCRSVRYNRSVARLLKRNKIVPLTQKSPHGVILSGAAQISKIKR